MYAAQWSELGGKANPQGLWDANFLILTRALHAGDSPENVRQALYDWLGNLPEYKRITPEKLDRMLELGKDAAYASIVQAIGGGLGGPKGDNLPPIAQQTLQKALAFMAEEHFDRREHSISQELEKLRGLRQTYRGEALAHQLLR